MPYTFVEHNFAYLKGLGMTEEDLDKILAIEIYRAYKGRYAPYWDRIEQRNKKKANEQKLN